MIKEKKISAEKCLMTSFPVPSLKVNPVHFLYILSKVSAYVHIFSKFYTKLFNIIIPCFPMSFLLTFSFYYVFHLCQVKHF